MYQLKLFSKNCTVFHWYFLTQRSDSYIWTEIKKEPGTPRALLNADEALKDFRSWVNNSHDLPAHDHAILFTG